MSTVAVREHPILFSGEMVRAILEGRKTQTRRVLRRQPAGAWAAPGKTACPFGQPGDRLWVRETFGIGGARFIDPCLNYRADVGHLGQRPIHRVGPDRWRVWDGMEVPAAELLAVRDGWRPSIHMPRWASRLTLELTEIRVERVQEINPWDVREEIGWSDPTGEAASHLGEEELGRRLLVERFRPLWDALNAKRGYSWESNPWVWCLSFRVGEGGAR